MQGRQGGVGADGVAGPRRGRRRARRRGRTAAWRAPIGRGEHGPRRAPGGRRPGRPRAGPGARRAPAPGRRRPAARAPSPAASRPGAAGRRAGRPDLVRCVPPVARARVDRRRHQHAGAVVEPQRADRQPGQPGDRADRQQGVLHAGGPWSLDPLEGQRPRPGPDQLDVGPAHVVPVRRRQAELPLGRPRVEHERPDELVARLLQLPYDRVDQPDRPQRQVRQRADPHRRHAGRAAVVRDGLPLGTRRVGQRVPDPARGPARARPPPPARGRRRGPRSRSAAGRDRRSRAPTGRRAPGAAPGPAPTGHRRRCSPRP